MNKLSKAVWTMVFCGVDVSAATLAVAVQVEDQPVEQRELANTASGHRALIAWLRRRKLPVRVALEAEPDLYLRELQAELKAFNGTQVSTPHLWKIVRELGFRLKKSRSTPSSAIPKRTGNVAKSS